MPGFGAVRTKGRIQVLEILQHFDGSVTTKNDGRFENKVSPVLNSKSTQNNSGVLQTYSSQKVLMSGSGYEPFSLVSIWANSTPTFLGSVNCNSIGSFSFEVAIPLDFQSGSHVLTTSGVIDSQEFTSSIGFQNFTTQSEVPIGKKLDPQTSATLPVSPTSSIALPTSTSSTTTTTPTTSTTSPTTTTTIPATLPNTTTTIATPLAAPAFTLSSSSETKAQNVAITGYTISSTGGTVASWSISPAQPDGLTFSTSTGLLSGTPTTVQTATAYTITATNATSTATQTFTLTVTATPLAVTYDSQGGSAISDGSTTVGGSISASPGTPTRTGYTFNGWFVASSGGTQISFPYTHGQTANFTLYAQWTGISQAISYAAGTGGSGSAPSSPTSVLYGSTFTTPSNTYSRSGYTFAGWNDGSTTYAAGATYPSSGTVAGSVTLTATWTATTLTISYAAGTGGSGSAPSSPTSVLYGSTFTTPANTYSRSGYTFAGWNDGSTTYAAGATYPSTGTATVSVTLTATWTVIPLAAPAFTLSPTSLSVPRNTTPASFYAITSTGGTVASWSISATPAGTTFNTSTGLLSGTPTTADNSGTNYTITATNATGTAQQIFNLKVTNN